MKLPIVKLLLSLTCAVLMMWTASGSADAGSAFYYSAGYGPSAYYAGYAPGYWGNYGTGYRGYGLWGASYASYYAPSYYATSYGGSACGSGCGSCGVSYRYDSCGSGCSSCGMSYGSCGSSCDPCGLSYGSCGSGCGISGVSPCGGCGIASIGCGSDCDTGISIAPAVQSTPNEAYDGSRSNPGTYDEDEKDDSWESPIPSTPDGRGRGFEPESDRGRGGAGGGGGGIFPGSSGGGGGANIERGANKVIPKRKDNAPATVEPSEEELLEDTPNENEDADVQPANINSQIAQGAAPVRARVRYAVRFHAPRIARLDVTPHHKWNLVEPDTKLAATR